MPTELISISEEAVLLPPHATTTRHGHSVGSLGLPPCPGQALACCLEGASTPWSGAGARLLCHLLSSSSLGRRNKTSYPQKANTPCLPLCLHAHKTRQTEAACEPILPLTHVYLVPHVPFALPCHCMCMVEGDPGGLTIQPCNDVRAHTHTPPTHVVADRDSAL